MGKHSITPEELARLKELKRALYHECLVLMRKYDNDVPEHVIDAAYHLAPDPQIQELLDQRLGTHG